MLNEKLKERDMEVLFLTDPIDEYVVQQLKEFEGKKLMCVTKDNMKMDDVSDETVAEFEPLCKRIKEVLGDKIEKVTLSDRVTSSPCVLVTGEYGWSANMERIMKAQAMQTNQSNQFMTKKTFEINPKHTIVKGLNKRTDDKTFKDLVLLMFDTSLLTSGFSLESPHSFGERMYRMISIGTSDEEETETDETAETEEVSEEMESVD